MTTTEAEEPNSEEKLPLPWNRTDVDYQVLFGDGNRRVTPSDMEKAAAAGAAAIRASLEGCNPPYTIRAVNVEMEYLYLQVWTAFKA